MIRMVLAIDGTTRFGNGQSSPRTIVYNAAVPMEQYSAAEQYCLWNERNRHSCHIAEQVALLFLKTVVGNVGWLDSVQFACGATLVAKMHACGTPLWLVLCGAVHERTGHDV